MRYQLLGRSGLKVSEACLGTITFGKEWGYGASKRTCWKILDEFASRGGNFIDTANNYTDGASERIVGEMLQSERAKFVIGTKYTMSIRAGDPNASGNHRKSLVQALEGSLTRLNTDYIDVYWVHAWDGFTPAEEVARALDDVVRAGKVLYIGISDTPAWFVAQSTTMADLRGWSRFVGLQTELSLLERTAERELLPMARTFGLTLVPWGVLGGGVLTGKYAGGVPRGSRRAAKNRDRITARNLSIASEAATISAEIGCPPSQVAIAWVRQRALVHGLGVTPILGARTLAQIRENLDGLKLTLSEGHLERLENATSISLGFPHELLARPSVQNALHGGVLHLTDGHRP
ncbi:MAG: aldo/keto reductase [Polyangiaceae bacterium]